MRKLILASHGDFAKGMLDSIEMITGKLDCEVETYGLQPGDLASDYATKIEKEIKENPTIEFVIVTDLYGASVASGLAPLSNYDNVVVFTGMCSSLILNLVLTYKNRLTKEDIENCIAESREGLQAIDLTEIDEEMEDF